MHKEDRHSDSIFQCFLEISAPCRLAPSSNFSEYVLAFILVPMRCAGSIFIEGTPEIPVVFLV